MESNHPKTSKEIEEYIRKKYNCTGCWYNCDICPLRMVNGGRIPIKYRPTGKDDYDYRRYTFI